LKANACIPEPVAVGLKKGLQQFIAIPSFFCMTLKANACITDYCFLRRPAAIPCFCMTLKAHASIPYTKIVEGNPHVKSIEF